MLTSFDNKILNKPNPNSTPIQENGLEGEITSNESPTVKKPTLSHSNTVFATNV